MPDKKWNASLKLVIFDCDGTLVDSQHAIVAAIDDTFSSFDMPTPPRSAAMSIIGLSLREAFAVLAPEAGTERQATMAAHYKTAFTQQRQARAIDEPLYPGIKDVVAALGAKQEFALAIATGKSDQGVDRLLDREDWHATFDSIQTADRHPSKPHPSMIFQALQDTDADPAQTVMIGDTSFDMDMARAAGVTALGVGWGYHPSVELERAGAHHITNSTETLLADIQKLTALRSEIVG